MTAAGHESRPAPLVRLGNYIFRFRDALFPTVLLALFVGFRPQYPRGSERLDNLLDGVGIAVALGGQLLRVAVIGYAYIIRGGRNRRVYAEKLVTEGFFAHSRNPLYFGNILVLLGLFLIYNNPWVYVLGGAFFLISYNGIVAAEEAYLRQKFGSAYEAYARAVPRWIPRLHGLRQSLAGMRFNWRRVVLKEYTSMYGWTAAAVGLLAADTLAHHPYQARATYLNMLWACLVLLTFAWGTARYLKKSRRLRAAPMSGG
jgi:protein-S-isoprenylcysteine O-methyltransferase Ste14